MKRKGMRRTLRMFSLGLSACSLRADSTLLTSTLRWLCSGVVDSLSEGAGQRALRGAYRQGDQERDPRQLLSQGDKVDNAALSGTGALAHWIKSHTLRKGLTHTAHNECDRLAGEMLQEDAASQLRFVHWDCWDLEFVNELGHRVEGGPRRAIRQKVQQ